MRIKGKLEAESGQPGKVTIMCDNADDLWHLYNVIQKGDFIKMKTFRKVIHENSSGAKTSEKKRIIITVKIEEIDYDQTGEEIRVKGKNVEQNQFVNVGQYQSLSIIKNVPFTLYKKYWDDVHLEKIRLATDPTITSDLAAVVMEEGIAHIFLISSHTTLLKSKIEVSIAKKRKGATQHDKGINKFFQSILDHLLQDVNFDVVKCVVIGSPGFTREQFANFMIDKSSNNDHYKPIKLNLNKFLYVHTSSGYKQSLQEVLSKPEILGKIKETKAMDDVVAMEKYNEILGKEMDRIVFGYSAIKEAFSRNAIEILLVTDDFLRKISITNRKELTKLMKDLEKDGSKVNKMSSRHVTGEKLNALGGITAILRYAIPELNDEEDTNDYEIEVNPEDDEVTFESFKKLGINTDMVDFSDDDKKEKKEKKEEKKAEETKEVKETPEEEKKDEEGQSEEENEYGELGNDAVKKDKNFGDKSKRKSSKLGKKERDVQRQVNSRKRSSFDNNF